MSWMYCVTLSRISFVSWPPSEPGASVEPKIGPNRKPMPPMNDHATTRIEVKLVNSERRG